METEFFNEESTYCQVEEARMLEEFFLSGGFEEFFTFATFYSGGGLGSHGLKLAGGKEVFAVDTSKKAERVFKLNHPDVPFFNMDARDASLEQMINAGLDRNLVSNLSVLLLSPPCTGISRVNPFRSPWAPINQLLLDCPRIIESFRPKVAIIENVEGLNDPIMAPLLHLLLAKLDRIGGYNFEYRVLDACDYGVPQHRKRWIGMLVSKDLGMPVFPEPTTKDYSALQLNRVLPGIVAYDLGGTRRKVFDPVTGQQTGWSSKFVSADRIVGTLTKTKGMKFRDKSLIPRFPYREEVCTICTTKSMKFTGLSDSDFQFVHGNGIMPLFMKAIGDCLVAKYGYKGGLFL